MLITERLPARDLLFGMEYWGTSCLVWNIEGPPGWDGALRGWILKPVHQASHPWLPTSALQGASHPVSNQHNGAPRVPMSTDPVEAVTRKGHQVTMGLLSQDPKWLTTHKCWHAKQCRKCICRMHNLLFNHYATHWGWVKHLTSSIIFMI